MDLLIRCLAFFATATGPEDFSGNYSGKKRVFVTRFVLFYLLHSMKRVIFMGTGEIGLPALDWLLESEELELAGVFTQPDKPAGRKQVLTAPKVKLRAADVGIPVFQPVSFKKEPESVELMKELNADLAVVMAYGQILPRAVFEAPRIGCVNLHASLLPRHRGASPIQAAIREGDAKTGITLMHIVERLDAGDMILKEEIDLAHDETGGSLHDRLAELGPVVLEQGIPLLIRGTAEREPQDEKLATFCRKLTRADGEIDWKSPADEIERMIRAYHPWPGATTLFPGRPGKQPRRVKLFPYSETAGSHEKTPGTILGESEPGMLRVACGGETSLRLTGDLQVEGKKPMSLKEFLRGFHLEPGQKLG